MPPITPRTAPAETTFSSAAPARVPADASARPPRTPTSARHLVANRRHDAIVSSPLIVGLTRPARREDGPAAVGGRALALLCNELGHARPGGMALELPRLRVEPLQGVKLLFAAKLGIADRGFQHPNRLVIDAQRHRERVPVLAAMGQRKPGRIAEPARRPVHH